MYSKLPNALAELKILGKGYSKYTGMVNLTKINLMRCEVELKRNCLLKLPHSSTRLTILDILNLIQTETLTEILNNAQYSLLSALPSFVYSKFLK